MVVHIAKFWIVLGVVSLTLVGCARSRQAPISVPFDSAEYSVLPQVGTGIVKGQVFAKTVGGDVKKGAGNEVRLMPMTANRMRAFRANDLRHRVADIVKITDGDGKFQMDGVPPGDYYITSVMTWETVSDNQYSRRLGLTDTQGGRVLKTVKVENDKVSEIMLTP